jgi:HD-GYP domain-containing protein (c-di-GMP phosphodiesterase class II)
VAWLRRAALLHDIGKLGVSNSILDKQGPLTAEERATMQKHTAFTYRILERVSCFHDVAGVAAAHHERLDGRGYALGLRADQLSLPARILAVADVADALAANRPYRKGMPPAQVLEILGREAHTGLCATCVDAIEPLL